MLNMELATSIWDAKVTGQVKTMPSMVMYKRAMRSEAVVVEKKLLPQVLHLLDRGLSPSRCRVLKTHMGDPLKFLFLCMSSGSISMMKISP